MINFDFTQFKNVDFVGNFKDDICLEVIPKLSNGVSPSNDDIRNILDKIAVIVDKKRVNTGFLTKVIKNTRKGRLIYKMEYLLLIIKQICEIRI